MKKELSSLCCSVKNLMDVKKLQGVEIKGFNSQGIEYVKVTLPYNVYKQEFKDDYTKQRRYHTQHFATLNTDLGRVEVTSTEQTKENVVYSTKADTLLLLMFDIADEWYLPKEMLHKIYDTWYMQLNKELNACGKSLMKEHSEKLRKVEEEIGYEW